MIENAEQSLVLRLYHRDHLMTSFRERDPSHARAIEQSIELNNQGHLSSKAYRKRRIAAADQHYHGCLIQTTHKTDKQSSSETANADTTTLCTKEATFL